MSAVTLKSVGVLFPTPTSPPSSPTNGSGASGSGQKLNASPNTNSSVNGASNVSLSSLVTGGNNPNSTQAYAALTNQPYPTPNTQTQASQQAAATQNLNNFAVAAKTGQSVPSTVSSNPFAAIQQLTSTPQQSQIINGTTPFQLAQSLRTVTSSPPGSNLNITV